MSTRIYYLRERGHLNEGDCTRGIPVAVIATNVNKEKRTIRYAIATTHSNDHFVKSVARHIAFERLNGESEDKKGNKKPKAFRKNAHKHVGEVKLDNDVPKSGREITKLVMLDIFGSHDFPNKVKTLAGEWVEHWASERLILEMKALQKPQTNINPVHRDCVPPPPMTKA